MAKRKKPVWELDDKKLAEQVFGKKLKTQLDKIAHEKDDHEETTDSETDSESSHR
jgi:hypothetical protein